MSVRIHQLSKEIGIENKELIQLLVERGFEVKSASSTIDNISAESLREEFAQKSLRVNKKRLRLRWSSLPSRNYLWEHW